jgi:heat shock protein HslJ
MTVCASISRGPHRRPGSHGPPSILPGMTDASIEGTWVVTGYLVGNELVEPEVSAPEPVMTVEGEQISGTMGVNRFTGRLAADLPVGPMAVTRMAGPPEAMAQEDALLAHLQGADHLEVDGPGMRMSRNGLTTIEFRRSGTSEDVPAS